MGPKSRLSFRFATDEDSRVVFSWRNDETAVRNSQSSSPVSWEVHKVWFGGAVRSRRCLLLIAELKTIASGETQKVGVVRFDLLAELYAEISINVNPAFRAQGFGRRLVEASSAISKQHFPKLQSLRATIMDYNAPSQRVFSTCGFELVSASPSGDLWEKNL
jgi:hypothetical protein